MTLNIKLKRSQTLNSKPTASQLEDGELGINYNAASLALYAKDSSGSIRTIAGSGSEGQYWDLTGSTLSPDSNTYGVDIGNGKIELKPDGSITAAGDLKLGNATAGNDGVKLFAGGGFNLYSSIAGSSTYLLTNYINGDSDSVFSVASDGSIQAAGEITAAGDVKIGGTSAAPNIELKGSDGSITAGKGIFSDAPSGADVGTLTVTNSTSVPANGRVFVGLDKDGNATTKIGADGTITAAGKLTLGAAAPASQGSVYYPASVDIRRDDGGAVYNVYRGGSSSANLTLQMNSDGNATFADTVGSVNGNNRSYLNPGNVDIQNTTKDTTTAFKIQGGRGTADIADVVTMTTSGAITAAGDIQIETKTAGGDDVIALMRAQTSDKVYFGSLSDSPVIIRPNNINSATFNTDLSVDFEGAITAAGQVQVGANAGDSQINIGGMLNLASGRSIFYHDSTQSSPFIKCSKHNGVIGKDVVVIDDNGAGTFKGNVTADRPTNTDSSFEAKNAGILNAKIRCDGTYFGQDTTIQPISSERRLKENIVAIDSGDAWETIKTTPYYAYNFIGQERTVYGPMADEVPAEMIVQPMEEVVIEEGVEPVIGPKGKVVKEGKEAVTEMRPRSDEEGPIRTYDNGMLQARLYTALQTALGRIEALEAEVNALKSA